MKINRNIIQDHYLNIKTNNKQNIENKTNKENKIKIEVSDSAKALVEKINQLNDVKNSEKVEKIRKAILEGKYKVSSEEIADKLIETISAILLPLFFTNASFSSLSAFLISFRTPINSPIATITFPILFALP